MQFQHLVQQNLIQKLLYQTDEIDVAYLLWSFSGIVDQYNKTMDGRKISKLCWLYALATGAVNSGLSVRKLFSLSSHEYISFVTISDSSPTLLAKSLFAQKSSANFLISKCAHTWWTIDSK